MTCVCMSLFIFRFFFLAVAAAFHTLFVDKFMACLHEQDTHCDWRAKINTKRYLATFIAAQWNRLICFYLALSLFLFHSFPSANSIAATFLHGYRTIHGHMMQKPPIIFEWYSFSWQIWVIRFFPTHNSYWFCSSTTRCASLSTTKKSNNNHGAAKGDFFCWKFAHLLRIITFKSNQFQANRSQ